MKKILFILSILLLNSCQSSNDLFVEKYQEGKIIKQSEIKSSKETSGVMTSQDLATNAQNKKKTKIALFFPMSGKNRELGISLYNSALISLFDNDINNNLELVVIDSKDSAIEALQAFQEIKNRNIKIVIGPVFGNIAQNLKDEIMRNSIKAISLSNNQELMNNIDEKSAIFVAGFSPEQQIDRIVSYGIDQEKENFAILAPNNSYGIKISKMIKSTVEKRDGTLIQTELYNISSNENLKKSVKRIVEAFSISAELAEGGGNKLDKNFRPRESDKNYADIIFVPENAKNLSLIASLIKEFNVDERRDSSRFNWLLGRYLKISNKNLENTLFAAPKNIRFANFEKSYYEIYNKTPPRISAIVYDSIAAIAQIIDKNPSKTIEVKDFVDYENNNLSGFEGIDGKFRFLKNGLTQRNLAVLKLEMGDFITIDEPNQILLKY